MKSIRELVALGHVVYGQFRRSACRSLELVAFHTPFGFGGIDG
jgi:hypothetical protein